MTQIVIARSYYLLDESNVLDVGVTCDGDGLIAFAPTKEQEGQMLFDGKEFAQIIEFAQKNGLIALPDLPKAATSFNHGGLWAIVELMGHTRIAGLVTEEEHFGAKMGRIEIPKPDGGGFTTQWFSGSSVYRITPTTEQIVMGMAKSSQPRPVSSWELSLPSSTEPISPHSHEEGDDDDDYSPL